jgi:O-antigen ligase
MDTLADAQEAAPEGDAASTETPSSDRRRLAASRVRAAATFALVLLPGALTVFLSFHGGGFFAGTTGLVATALAVVLIVRTTSAGRPFDGLGPAATVAVGALALLAVWTLASTWWSDSSARALLSFDRVLLYTLLIVVMASVAWLPRSLRAVLRAVVLGIFVVCLIALITRVLPDVWHVAPNLRNERLSYPLTYWNALGILAAVGFVLSLHLTCDNAEPRVVRALGVAAVPVLAATLLFTYSRGAMAACVIGIVIYLLVARPRGAVTGLLVAAPSAAVAVVAAYRADLLAKPDFATHHAAVSQGHKVALVVALCAVLGALARFALTWLDDRVERVRLPHPRRGIRIGAWAGAAVVVIGIALAAGAPHQLDKQFHRFTHGDTVRDEGDFRSRLSNVGNNGRLEHWRVALVAYRSSPANGTGGGTYQIYWLKDRRLGFTAVNAHSLYLETLAELGIIGLVLLLVALGALIVGVASRARGSERALRAAVLAALLTWAIHAGVDWDWQMPAVGVGVLGLAAAAAAAPRRARRRRERRKPGPVARLWLAAGLLVLAVPPALVAVSQQRLNDAVSSFQRGDCAGAIDRALASNSALSIRPEPFEVIGYCDARLGQTRLATTAFNSAISRDPQNWELHYGLGIVRAAGGLSPRAALQQALRLDPRESVTLTAIKELNTSNTRRLEKTARSLPITIRSGRSSR